MTLGRTADNKIKIKTDGTTRAVECACCGCSECETTPTAELIPILDAATTATCNGLPPTNWVFISLPASPGWYAIWAYSNIYTLRWFSDTKCLNLAGDNALNIIQSGGLDCCDLTSFECVEKTYTINGNSFPCHSEIFDDLFPSVPSPSFVFP